MDTGRADYGIDAPGVVRNLVLMGIAGIALSALGYFLGGMLGITLAITGHWCSFIGFAEAGWMVWGSLVGKRRLRDRMLDDLSLKGDERVLDVGCGRGLLLNGAGKRLPAGRAVGLDLWKQEDQSGNSPDAALANARAEGVADHVEVRAGDMREMPFPDGTFDAVVSNIAIHNVPDEPGRARAVREIARVLKPGGRAALADFRNTAHYARTLRDLGWTDVRVSGLSLLLFPPVRVVRATKPAGPLPP